MGPKGKYQTILHYYETIPEGDGPFPTIVLMVHAHGIDDSSKKVCEDLAAAGYYTVAPDPYLNGSYNFQTRTDDIIFKGLDLMLATLEKNPLADMNRLGIIGFCMGGRHAYLANVYHDVFKTVVPYYGFPHRGATPESTPKNRIADFSGPVFSIFGELDQGIPMDVVKAYQAATEGESSIHSSVVYEGAGHGFLNHTSRNHHAEATADAWKKTIDFFDKHLKA
ncbi:MAG: dienelactone hydrolase family protein [Candidatus Heimdallarchaeota archaeon]|nr:dienelactone hydrolase family protein [Candidatus Heimdallarchaeota archaeon]